jgi:hypothetical protein
MSDQVLTRPAVAFVVVRERFVLWSARRWLVAGLVTVVAALVIGVPTGVVPTPFYTRMTPTVWWNYPVWAVSALLVGLTAATYVRDSGLEQARRQTGGRTIGGALLSVFAVGCPICNKLVVALIGASGALTYFQPLQPVLAVASLVLLAVALGIRLRGERACAVPAV